jgi:multidrug efflux system membrane fusion protein
MALHETLRVAEGVPHNIAGRLNGLSTRSRWIVYGLGAAILLFIVWELAAPLFAAKKKPPPAPPVKVATAMRKNVTVMQNTIGTVVSPAMVQVTAQVTGKLLAANFREGDIVHKGDLLFQIDPAPYEAVLGQAQGVLARDTATLANDRIDLTRYQQLAAQNAISTSSWSPRKPRSSRTRAWS